MNATPYAGTPEHIRTAGNVIVETSAASAEAPSKLAGTVSSLRCDAMVGARVESGLFRKFQKGDTVFHWPTGETWSLIADEKDGWVTPGGWPPSQGRAEDCKLVERGRQAEDESVRQPSPNSKAQP